MKLEQRCEAIELILCDVDGVMTDGGLTFDNQGVEYKTFHVRDGSGVKLWQRAGWRFGLVTGRSSHIVQVRSAELGIDLVRQGVGEKLPAVRQILTDLNLSPGQVCYVGDDLPDLPVLSTVGLAVAVADACEEIRAAAHFTTTLPGGHGAVRELIELILKHQRRWDDVIRKFQS
jgi:YrbI family 3-deoxy-D-manno-octulosonate 8-phosphate phosphatase